MGAQYFVKMDFARNFLAFFILICDTEGSLQQLPADLYPLAKCNDGTQANYHVQNYHKQGKIVISLQGGGYCDSIDACLERCAMLTSHEDAVFTGAFGCQPFPNSPEHEEFRE